MFFTRVNRLHGTEDTDLRRKGLSKEKQVSQDHMGILDLPKTERQKYFDLKRVGPETVYEGLDQFLRIRVCGGNRRLAMARDMSSMKCPSID